MLAQIQNVLRKDVEKEEIKIVTDNEEADKAAKDKRRFNIKNLLGDQGTPSSSYPTPIK